MVGIIKKEEERKNILGEEVSYILILYIHVNFEYIPYIDCLRFSFFLQPVLIKIKIPSVGFPSIEQ